jgi:hypothetical protein
MKLSGSLSSYIQFIIKNYIIIDTLLRKADQITYSIGHKGAKPTGEQQQKFIDPIIINTLHIHLQ